MPKTFDVTVVGDVHVQQFRPVQWVKESIHGDDVPIYRSDDSMDTRRTRSPGGAAFVAHLLQRAGLKVQALLPIRPKWNEELLPDFDPATPNSLTLIALPAPSSPNTVESFYMNSAGSWRLQMRLSEVHMEAPTTTATLAPAAMLVVDDYDRGAVTREVLASAASCGAERIILSAQHRNRHMYDALTPSVSDLVVVCSEREALAWSGLKTPPTRFPPGHPSDHKDLIKLVLVNMMGAFPSANHVIVNIAGPQLTSLHLTRSKTQGEPHNVALVEPARAAGEVPTESVPGVEAFYLAALVNALGGGDSYELAVARAVSAVAKYAKAGIKDRTQYFGRMEELPAGRGPTEAATSWLVSIGTDDCKAMQPEDNFLRDAQLHGKLRLEPSVLADYYAPEQLGQQLGSLMKALTAYSEKSNKRPFNVLLDAEPGSGKSYFAYCLARQLDRSQADRGGAPGQYPLEEKNLSLAGELPLVERALIDLYETIRDHRAVGRTPVVLIDEFDALLSGKPAEHNQPDDMDKLFAKMLAPLWDGVFAVNGRLHRLGGFVLLLAVSSDKFMERLRNARGKAKDFLSRIDIQLDLRAAQKPEEQQKSNVSVAVAMLRKYYGPGAKHVELAVLDAIAQAEFAGKNRAIDQLIMMSSRPASGVFSVANLPDEKILNGLATRIDVKGATFRFGTSFVEI